MMKDKCAECAHSILRVIENKDSLSQSSYEEKFCTALNPNMKITGKTLTCSVFLPKMRKE